MDWEQFMRDTQPLRDAHAEFEADALTKWAALPEEEKMWILEAVTTIMVNSEQAGTSHRGLMDDLGVYPAGFWVTNLMTIHNALWTEFHEGKDDNYKLKEKPDGT